MRHAPPSPTFVVRRGCLKSPCYNQRVPDSWLALALFCNHSSTYFWSNPIDLPVWFSDFNVRTPKSFLGSCQF